MIDTKMHNLITCPTCKSININANEDIACRTCHSTIKDPNNANTQKTWAYLITALIAYIPANIYPILLTTKFMTIEETTMLGGIIDLWEKGSYPIASIIFFASIMVPILKFISLIYLLLITKNTYTKEEKRRRHTLFYITDASAPWSMVDIFIVGILVGLVNFNDIQIIPGPAATAFTLSVFFTMLASRSFNLSLIKEDK